MILKCPKCGEEYEVTSTGKIEHFNMKCQVCGTIIDSDENEEVEVRRINEKNETIIVKTEKSHSGCLWKIFIIFIIFAVLAITCPDKAKHAEKIRSIGIEYINNEAGDENGFIQGLAFLVGPHIIDMALTGGLQIDNYIIFNIGRIKYQDINKPVTIGILNNVFFLGSPNMSNNNN